MNEEKKDNKLEKGKRAMEYAQQLAWLISLKKNSYITEDEYEACCNKLRIKYHQTPRL